MQGQQYQQLHKFQARAIAVQSPCSAIAKPGYEGRPEASRVMTDAVTVERRIERHMFLTMTRSVKKIT